MSGFPISEHRTPNASFPVVRWGDQTVTFEPVIGPRPPAEVFAVVVFARHEDGFVIADIPERGWVAPSGRLAPGETPLEAAIRETREETGAVLENPREIGRYVLTEDDGRKRVVPAFIGIVREFGALPPESESRGTRCVSRAELPSVYWRWDALLARMFKYAEEFVEQGETVGVPES